MKLIDADGVYQETLKYSNRFRKSVLKIVNALPTVDAVEVRHAYDTNKYPSLFECSNCGWTCDDTYGGEPCVGNTVTYNYCPNCGAKIDYKKGYA